uniref:Uncharacterized protein n=1 Tax=Sphaerodactylus townsendi TaxID=933632 RepID=A0ACB8GBD2_9SAUR
MEEGDGGEDSLFSLELLVESARVEPRLLPSPLPASGPFRPAVALRLLDFPTLLVRAPHCGPGPLVPFGRGKSCLFRLRPNVLRGLLRRSPLHALLLALPPTAGPARLLGSCSVSLADAAEELLLGGGPRGRRGRFPLRDLMGEPVGELGLSYRFSNLGSTLLAHLRESTGSGEPHREEEEQPPSPTPLGTQDEREPSLELISKVEEGQGPGSDSLSCTEPQPNDTGYGDTVGELETETNIFCPPPMYYNYPAEDCCPAPKASEPVMVAEPQESFQEEENTLPPGVPVNEELLRGGQDMCPSPPTLVNALQLRQTLSQLPLLNALLVELSLLNNQTLPPGPSSVHPQLAWLYQNVEEGSKTPPPYCKSDLRAALLMREDAAREGRIAGRAQVGRAEPSEIPRGSLLGSGRPTQVPAAAAPKRSRGIAHPRGRGERLMIRPVPGRCLPLRARTLAAWRLSTGEAARGHARAIQRPAPARRSLLPP